MEQKHKDHCTRGYKARVWFPGSHRALDLSLHAKASPSPSLEAHRRNGTLERHCADWSNLLLQGNTFFSLSSNSCPEIWFGLGIISKSLSLGLFFFQEYKVFFFDICLNIYF